MCLDITQSCEYFSGEIVSRSTPSLPLLTALQMDGDSAGAADIFKQAAQQWMLQGDARKAADAYDNAAAEVCNRLDVSFSSTPLTTDPLCAQLENVSEDGAAVAYDRGGFTAPHTQYMSVLIQRVGVL